MKGKTFYVRKSQADLSKMSFPNAGPRPSIRGMRQKFWGFDCDLAIQGAYVYVLPPGHNFSKTYAGHSY